MSQAGLVDIEQSHPQIPTSFTTDAGTAIPIANNLEILGTNGITTSGAGKTVTVTGVTATAAATAPAATIGVCSFDSKDFDVTAGYVQIAGSFGGVQAVLTDDGAPAVESDSAGEIEILGASGIDVTGQGPGNVITVSGSNATTTNNGMVFLATDAQSIGGVLTNNYAINPSSLKAKLGVQTDHGILIGSGTTNAITALAEGATGELVVATTFADPSWSTTSYGDFSFSNITAVATPRMLEVVNVDVNAASHADLRLSTPPLGGDSCISWEVQGSHFFSAGVDNQVAGDPWKLSNSSYPSAGTAAITVDATTAAVTFASAYEFPVADGTASYPLVTDGAGNLDFNSLTVAGGGTGATSITDHALIVGSGTGAVTEIGPLGSGELVIGSVGADPAVASLTAPAAGITITGGAGTVTFALADDLAGIEALATTGIVSRTAANTYAATTVTEHAILIGAAGELPTNLGPLGNGEIIIGSVGAAPVAATLTDGNNITFTEGAGSITANVTGTTQYAVQVGDATGSLDSIGVGAVGTLLVGAGAAANPAFGTSANGDFTFTSSTAGATRSLTVTNTEAANAASHAKLDIVTGGANGGDPYLHLNTGVTEYSIGADNTSTTDLLKITTGASPSAGTTLMTIGNNGVKDWVGFFAGAVAPPTIDDNSIRIKDEVIGGNVGIGIANSDNTDTGSDAGIVIQVGGSSAGDPFLQFASSAAVYNNFGVDNSDSDKLKIDVSGSRPGQGTNIWTMTTAGERTMPLQPAFLAYLGTQDANVTGDATDYTLGSGNALTEIFDQNADFNTNGTFTAPVTGRYMFYAQITFVNTVGYQAFVRIPTSNRTYYVTFSDPTNVVTGGSNHVTYATTIIADMDAADTAIVKAQLTGGAKTADVDGAGFPSKFGGSLIC